MMMRAKICCIADCWMDGVTLIPTTLAMQLWLCRFHNDCQNENVEKLYVYWGQDIRVK